MKYKDVIDAGVKHGPGGYGCGCCRGRYSVRDIHKKIRKMEKNRIRQELQEDFENLRIAS